MVVAAWLTLSNVLMLGTSAVSDASSEFGFRVWSALLAALALAPFPVAYLRWRRGQRAGLGAGVVLWSCVLSLLALGIASLPFTLVVIAA